MADNKLTFKTQAELMTALYHLGHLSPHYVYSGCTNHFIAFESVEKCEQAKQILAKEKTQ